MERFGNVVVFGLEDREDRWLRSKEILEEIGVKKVTRYATQIDPLDKHRHCTKDFLQMLRRKGQQNIVFFEDDFELVKGWEEVLDKAWKDLPDDWDLLYMGANLTSPPQKITDNLLKIRGAWMFHAVIMRDRFINYILNKYDVNRYWVFDEWLRQEAIRRHFYMTYPMISYQRAGYSDLVGQYVNYDIFNNKFYTRV